MSSLRLNIIYNTVLQIFNLIFPFLMGAYISRILGAQNLGEINFSQSILVWINVIASLGIPTYGIREIAIYKKNEEKIKKIFSELVLLRGIISIGIIMLYYLSIFFIPILREQIFLFIITGFGIVFNLFNVDWFFSGIEDYKTITLRSIIIKVITFIIIILFIKKPTDYILYAFILIIGQGISNIWSFFYSLKKIKFVIDGINCFRHLKKIKFFLFSALITSVYTTLNTIVLGFLNNAEGVAFFVRARQIQGIGISLTGSIATVLIPRISYYYHNEKIKYNNLLKKSLNYNYIISIPLCILLIILSKPINIFLGGEEFVRASNSLIILSPLVIIISIGTWLYFQIIIPSGKEKVGTFIQGLMAVINILLNFLFIPKLGYNGASISLLITEIIGPLLIALYLKNKEEIKLITKSFPKYVIASIVMGGMVYLLKLKMVGFILLMISGILGILVYLVVLVVLKEEIIYEFYIKIKKKESGYKDEL